MNDEGKKEKKVKAPKPAPVPRYSQGTMSHRGPLSNSVLATRAKELHEAMSQPNLSRRLRGGYRRAAALIQRATPLGFQRVLG